ncbi:TetR/AcrR family transcriptional regulator [Streptomyces sp. NBC_01361]|uniref:TetR/AcrR family transcriptional regulator n=1 Tax=Streptomyces sp. NBC_01361 TaxID=2903838 RepID=UPI003FCDF700
MDCRSSARHPSSGPPPPPTRTGAAETGQGPCTPCATGAATWATHPPPLRPPPGAPRAQQTPGQEPHLRSCPAPVHTAGTDQTTVDEITEAADVARGTFFNHFQRREDLIAEWGEQRRELLRQGLRAEGLEHPRQGHPTRALPLHEHPRRHQPGDAGTDQSRPHRLGACGLPAP